MRGSIYDSQGRLLASDSIIYQAWLDLRYLRQSANNVNLEDILESISNDFSVPLEELQDTYNSESAFLLIGSSPTMDEISRRLTQKTRSYISVEIATDRLSFSDFGLDKIIGSLDIGGYPLGGIEKSYNDLLKGKENGKIKRSLYGTERIEPKNGNDIYLSINLDLQKIVYEELEKGVKRNKASGGTAILYESRTGKILAYANTYNWDVGLMGVFEPGSTIKPLIYSLALESSSITEESRFFCDGKIQPVKGLDNFIRDTEGEKHGIQTFRDALRNSCNVATTQVVDNLIKKVGNQAYFDYLTELGFGKQTGVDLPSESPGIFSEPKNWSSISPYQFGIGQGIGSNIFQISRALNSFAANGQLLVPSFVKAIGYDKGINLVEPVVEDILFDEVLVKTMLPVLESVVASGTGTRAKIEGIRIGGKTGTAQKAGPDGYNNEDFYSNFWGFFPIESPEYSLYITIDTPRGEEYYGGNVSGPVFSAIVKRLYGMDIEEPNFEGFYNWKMPDLSEYTLTDIYEIAEIYGIEDVKIHGAGLVKKQIPEPGMQPGNTLEIWFDMEEK